MYFSLVSRRRYLEMSRATGKGVGCRVYGWLLMAALAGQVGAQTNDCMDSLPACNLSFEPSDKLLLGESFNVTCTIPSDECNSMCYDSIQFLYTVHGGEARSSAAVDFVKRNPFFSITSDVCSQTLSINSEVDQLQNDYLRFINNAQWQGVVVRNLPDAESASAIRTTKVQVLRSGIPQESIQSNIVQPLNIIMNAIALSDSQQTEGNYRAKVMLRWSDAESLESPDGTYFGREYQVNGTTPEGSVGQLTHTTTNSAELTLSSRQTVQNLTLITVNRLGIGDTASFQVPWPEPSISLNRQGDSHWLMVVEFGEAVKDLTVFDSQFMSVALEDLEIIDNTDNDILSNSTLMFTANLMDGQDYTIRLNLENPTTTEESQTTMEESLNTTPLSITMPKETISNSGISSQALPGLLASAVMAAMAVNRLMQGHSASP